MYSYLVIGVPRWKFSMSMHMNLAAGVLMTLLQIILNVARFAVRLQVHWGMWPPAVMWTLLGSSFGGQ